MAWGAQKIEPAVAAPGRRDAPGDVACQLPPLRTLEQALDPSADPHMTTLAGWVRHYLMQPHPDLGRAGHVCPFTARAARLELLRLGLSDLQGHQTAAILGVMGEALRLFDTMAVTKTTRVYRTIIIGFPRCADAAGLATLHAVQNALRHHSVVRAKMIGLFEPNSQAEGLINPHFRPLRAPIPALAIRMLVEQDAPFVLRNPLLLPVYLTRFPVAGTRRLARCLLASWKRARSADATGGKHQAPHAS